MLRSRQNSSSSRACSSSIIQPVGLPGEARYSSFVRGSAQAASTSSVASRQPSLPCAIGTWRTTAPLICAARITFGQEGVTQTATSPGESVAWHTCITAFMPEKVKAMRSSGSSTPYRRR